MPDDVLVKLPDGTFVRKPMREVLAMAEPGGSATDDVRRATDDAGSGRSGMMPLAAKTVFQPPPPFRDAGIESVAERIVGQCRLPEGNQSAGRLKTFVLQYLEGRAKQHELKEFLARSEKIGGLGLSEPQASACSQVIESEITQGSFRVRSDPRPPRPLLPLSGASAAPLSLALAPPKRLEPRVAPPAPRREVARQEPVANKQEAAAVNPEARPAVAEQAGARPTVVDVRVPKASSPPPVPSAPPTQLQGPAQEFSMNLQDFQRLGEDPRERVEILKQKIGRLAREGYALKAAAVSQWKNSGVFRLYLDGARQAMARALSVSDALSALSREGKPALTIDEFTAIGKFNRWLGL